jgi:hypothetical protein
MTGTSRRAPGGSLARRADRYDLYQRAVQDAEADVAFLDREFRKAYGRAPRVLREDFGGTALLACEWVKRRRANRAIAIDLDPEPLAWCRAHNLPSLSEDARRRVRLVRGDVRSARTEPADVTVAFNFSYSIFTTRPALLAYFRMARSTLRRQGLFALDLYGGFESHAFDPLTHLVTNYIHFRFRDGSRLERAFTYHWRLWTAPELMELLSEAGFSDVGAYFEGTDRAANDGNGVFTRRRRGPDDPAWIAFLVARR